MNPDDRDDWPTPAFDHEGTIYPCGVCSELVVPDDGDPQAGLVIVGGTWKLCYDCATTLRDAIDATAPESSIDELTEALREGSA